MQHTVADKGPKEGDTEMLLRFGKLFNGNREDDLQRLMRTEFGRDYRQIQKMNNGHVDARAYLELNMGHSRRD